MRKEKFEKGGMLGQRVGALRRDGGLTLLQTIRI